MENESSHSSLFLLLIQCKLILPTQQYVWFMDRHQFFLISNRILSVGLSLMILLKYSVSFPCWKFIACKLWLAHLPSSVFVAIFSPRNFTFVKTTGFHTPIKCPYYPLCPIFISLDHTDTQCLNTRIVLRLGDVSLPCITDLKTLFSWNQQLMFSEWEDLNKHHLCFKTLTINGNSENFSVYM